MITELRRVFFRFYSQLFLKHGLTFSPDIEAATADQIMPLVEHNLGISFVPEVFFNINQNEGIYRINLNEDIPSRSVCLIKKRDRTLSPPAKEIERIVTQNEFE